MGRFLTFVNERTGRDLGDFDALLAWSTTEIEEFWAAIWDFFEVRAHTPYETVLEERTMPGARWFTGATLNFAEHLVGRDEDADRVAIVARSQTRDPFELTFGELRERVARARAGLQRLGVGPGDRVAAYLPNIPETLIAFAATASLGAIWASCAPEFGARSVIDRFGQIEPKVLLAVAGYTYGEKWVDRAAEVRQIREGVPSIEHVVDVPYGEPTLEDTTSWDDLLAEDGPLTFDAVPFDHPVFVLFSSGTTGLPKAIVHCHGGILVESFKNLGLSWDLGPGDRLQWFSTTAWMMWNALISCLLLRASIVMLDGNPGYPDLSMQWRLLEELECTHVGFAPAFLMGCRKAGLQPGRDHDLSHLRMMLTAGSPLPLEGYAYAYEQIPPAALLNNGSGGTDICSGMVGGSPLQPVYAGEISGRVLGCATQAYDENGQPVVGELGELVITQPLPSMPVAFWGDTDGARMHAAYFDVYPGVWRHGDWIRFTERGSCVVTGRSRRDPQPRRRAPGHQRAVRGRRGRRGGARLADRAPGGPRGRQRRADPVLRAARRHRARRRAAQAHRALAARRAQPAARARHDRRRALHPAHDDRQEARGPRQADPAGHPGRARRQPRRARPARRPGRLRALRRHPSASLGRQGDGRLRRGHAEAERLLDVEVHDVGVVAVVADRQVLAALEQEVAAAQRDDDGAGHARAPTPAGRRRSS